MASHRESELRVAARALADAVRATGHEPANLGAAQPTSSPPAWSGPTASVPLAEPPRRPAPASAPRVFDFEAAAA
jgi:hypothetical protein